MNRTLPLALLALLTGCAAQVGNGVSATQVREVDAFDSVRNTLFAELEVAVGGEQTVEVECDENLVDDLLTRVEDGTLVVTSPPHTTLMPRTDCVVWVSLPELVSAESSGSGGVRASGEAVGLERARCSGSGTVVVEGIDTTSVEADSSGSGGIELDGVADEVDLENSGSGGIDARDLSCDEAALDNSASGSVHLTVYGEVSVELSGSGDIVLYGDPQVVDQRDTGSGQIVIRD